MGKASDVPVKLVIAGGIDAGKSAAAAAVRDTLRDAGLDVRTRPDPDAPSGAAFVVDDADQLTDTELAALTSLAADPARTVVVAVAPRLHHRRLRELTTTLERERPRLRLPARRWTDPVRLASRLRGLDDELADTLTVLSLDDALGPADVAAALGIPLDSARDLVDRGYATGLLDPAAPGRDVLHDAASRAVGALRHHELETALLDSQLEMGTLTVSLAVTLAEHGVRDARLADRLAESGRGADPVEAARCYRAALSAGAGDADPLPFADALALAGDCAAATRIADDLLGDSDPGVRAAAVRIAASTACHDGNTAHAAELFGWLADQPAPHPEAETVSAATVVAMAVGDLPAARAALRAEPSGPPTSSARRARNLAEGLLMTIDEPYGAAIGRLSQAVGGPTEVAMPDDPAALAALTALHAGDPARAAVLVGRDAGHNRLFENRRLLLAAWTQLLDGQVTAAAAGAAAVGADPHPRDALWLAALQTGIARRAGDAGALHRHWHAGMAVLTEYCPDLYSLLPLGELWVAAARLRQADRLRHPLQRAFAVLSGLGNPPAWSLPLHWAGVHAAILAGTPDSMTPHAAALSAAAAHSDFARALAAGGRAWLRVLAGQVEAAEVSAAARGLAQFGLTWDATRLAGQAALGATDPRVSAAMLALARDLKLTVGADDPAPAEADQPAARPPAARGAVLSDREREVAELLLLGMPYRDIGAQLFISAKTVEHHVARIRRRLDAGSRSEMLSMLRSMLAPQT
ncbi:helix-turn-helix transcriptional regulator [Mycolicibacterium brumae]|uniref:LuxR family transcriptional regulator n=1 Tax=Mycolicibacterium brumae TaxID=85968 RepID=A0A2G5PG38_9MYCO|nr:helix-turn-helix transcriptional regulator [Mycolicibacterium brumae]PIB77285.1 LuxR family transcriptional regulator [Mycolicibacterium brumae]